MGHAEGGSAGRGEGGVAGHGESGGGTGGYGEGGANPAGGGGKSGATGTGGGGAQVDCTDLVTLATKELASARACSLSADAEQCTGAVDTACNCEVPVEKNDSAATKAYLATLKELNAKHCLPPCGSLACSPVTRAECKADSAGSSKGTCSASFGLPTPGDL